MMVRTATGKLKGLLDMASILPPSVQNLVTGCDPDGLNPIKRAAAVVEIDSRGPWMPASPMPGTL